MTPERLAQLRQLANYATYVGAGGLSPDAGDDILELCDAVASIEQARTDERVFKAVEQLPTYAMNIYGTEFGGLVERDKVLAILGKA